jgi:putative PEP-CTERM system histidine kinase
MKTSGFKLSRNMMLALFALIAATIMFLAVAGAASLLVVRGGISSALMLFALPLVIAVLAAVFLPAPRTRGWVKVMLAKHVFAHRYDYRAEWLRFNETLGSTTDTAEPLSQRVIKAIADITDSPAGMLLTVDDGGLTPKRGWNWDMAGAPNFLPCEDLAAILTAGRIIELDPLRAVDQDDTVDARALPVWLVQEAHAWVIVPLVHLESLTGAVVIARPAVARTLDWEDFDLLRVAGRQAASYLAEERGQEALSDAARFEEFNRRFAFIMHDIKNLNSQLALVAHNAERHAEKPAFRADMIATLNSSTKRMSDLIAKLSQHGAVQVDERRPVVIGSVISRIATTKRMQHPIVISGETGLCAMADGARLEMALTHIIQNAIDASAPVEPVTVTVQGDAASVVIDVTDRGLGMTPEFIRNQLFRPFASTKANGFGIGAFEARSLIVAMGGQLSVISDPDSGSRFTITLPAASQWHEALVA